MDKYEMLMKCYDTLNSSHKVSFDDYIENVIKYPDGMLNLLFSMYVKKTDFAILDSYFKNERIYYAIRQAIIDNQRMITSDRDYYLKLQQEFEDIINCSYQKKYVK